MANCSVVVHNEVSLNPHVKPYDWNLWFQWATYHYDDGRPAEDGYRFIWTKPDGKLQAARGQARIPTAVDLLNLLDQARKAGWFY